MVEAISLRYMCTVLAGKIGKRLLHTANDQNSVIATARLTILDRLVLNRNTGKSPSNEVVLLTYLPIPWDEVQ